MNVPVLLAGLDPSREFRRDFGTPAAPIAPIRRVKPVADVSDRDEPEEALSPPTSTPRSQRRRFFSGTCEICGVDFARLISAVKPEPRTCGVACARALGHRRQAGVP